MEIQVNGKAYFVSNLEQETNKVLSSRLWFIIKQNPQNDIEFQEAEKWSIIWYYMTYYKCQYLPEIEQKVLKMSQFLYV